MTNCQRHPLSKWTSRMERYSWTISPFIWIVSSLHSVGKLIPELALDCSNISMDVDSRLDVGR